MVHVPWILSSVSENDSIGKTNVFVVYGRNAVCSCGGSFCISTVSELVRCSRMEKVSVWNTE